MDKSQSTNDKERKNNSEKVVLPVY